MGSKDSDEVDMRSSNIKEVRIRKKQKKQDNIESEQEYIIDSGSISNNKIYEDIVDKQDIEIVIDE